MSRLREAKKQALALFELVISNDSDEDKFTAINNAKDTLSKPFIQKFFDKEMFSVVEFFIDSECANFSEYCRALKFRWQGDSKLIIADYEANEVTLAKQLNYDQSYVWYYLFHPLNGKVKTQRWTTDNGCTSDFISNSISDAINEIGAGSLAIVPEEHRNELQDQFLESEARYQSNRTAYEAQWQ